MSPWWYIAHKFPEKAAESRLIVQLLLNKDRRQHTVCHYCNTHVLVNTEHILFEGIYFDKLRKQLWSKVVEACPINLIIYMSGLSSRKKCIVILNGFNSSNVSEWYEIYTKVSSFIYVLYKYYDKDYDK